METDEHIAALRNACKGIDQHAENNPAIWAVLNDIELDVHELDKAFEDEKLMEKDNAGCNENGTERTAQRKP